VHLRGGPVARGGIRWSDRREDFRTEVLGLMKAQMVKNAVIVPVGAKGGFVVKRPPAAREDLPDEVVFCYRTFIRGLLDITDDIENGEVVPPADVVRYDGDDPYLVVAADKGTATFSDLANSIAAERGFWLGDAFASGGSSGYDHKKMGITARGAWESVRRHFRHLGVDAAAAPLTVAGIGDMSGDVFGNGMLCSPHLRLVAAFDHRHVFFDPDPYAAAAYAERRRLFVLGRSSWADYDTSRISPGGGVFPRTAKSIPLSPEVRAVLDTDAATLPPNEVVRAILAAPVDLLWNGGIGTYAKASTESHADAGDKSNDPVRIDATEVRASVVAEGGNLGFTQRARVEYAIAGGRIHTDAIDNSAGVDCSDHEVNIKILLDAMVADGDLTTKQRNQLLTEMADDVAALVLADNYAQTGALAMALTQAPEMAGVHMRYMRRLEGEGRLNRALEFLPSDEALTARRAATGLGLVAPEFAVLLAYTKLEVAASLGSGDAADDPWLGRELTAYFPPALRDGRFAEAMARHPLRREIVAARVTNTLVDRAGTSFVHRLTEETGAPVAELARAHAAAREMYGLDGFWTEIEGLDTRVRPEIQLELALEGRRLAERATRWLVRHQPAPLPVAHLVDAFSAGVAEVERRLPDLVPPSEREAMEEAAARWEADGVTAGLAARAAVLRHCHCALDIVEVARGAGHPVEGTAAAWYALGSHLELDWLRSRVVALPRDDRWQALARGALRDDCDGLRAALTTATLGTAGGVEGWVAEHRPAVWRFLAVLDEIRSVTAPDCASLSVAMRELRAVLAGG
ncbi:MAG: NAD-glutamate dehydrogenase domain-containing protein, partial [Acidimicrobiia bacterium]